MNLNGTALAYIGDSYYEHQIRCYLIDKGLTKVNELHTQATQFTSAKAQAEIMQFLLNGSHLTEEEILYYKRGRNQSHPGRKNVSLHTYHEATGFESLIGYLQATSPIRANEIIAMSIQFIEERL